MERAGAMVLNDCEYNKVWERVYHEFEFQPSMKLWASPFSIRKPYAIYDISKMRDENLDGMDDLITKAILQCTEAGDRWYALDWQHSAFLFDPRKPEERESVWVEDPRYTGGGYTAYFPGYYPDGDYYFFIDARFRYGYLGHPWQRKVWIFGTAFLMEMEQISGALGWKKV